MASESCIDIIKENDQVVVRKDKNLKVVPVRRNSKLWIERSKFFLDSAIGFPYGTRFEVVNQKLIKVDSQDAEGDIDLEIEEEEDDGIRDNRHLTDTSHNQKLSSDNIRDMRKQGVHGEDIVEQLIQNSSTFNQKNEFARQKYVKKKKKKYVPVITLLKPTARLLLEMYYNKGPSRICNLRIDSLAQLLAQANVQAGSKLLVVETCVGLVVGAVMERMGGHGAVIQLYSGSAPVRQCVESFDFPKHLKKMLCGFPLYKVCDLNNPAHKLDEDITAQLQMESSDSEEMEITEELGRHFEEENKEQRWHEKQTYLNKVKAMIEQADSDGLIVVTKFHPSPIVMSLIDFVGPSRPIVVFCQYKEPLMDLYVKLRDHGGVILLRLTETWLRGYQVLPNRTHPNISMSGSGGYLLTGTTVALDYT